MRALSTGKFKLSQPAKHIDARHLDLATESSTNWELNDEYMSEKIETKQPQTAIRTNNSRKFKTVLFCISSFLFGANLLCSQGIFAQNSDAERFFKLQEEAEQNVKSHNFALALENFQTALKLKPDSWQLQQDVGFCEMELQHFDKAIAALQKSIEIDGLHSTQCTNMAAVYQRIGEPQKALAWLRLACSVDPELASNKQMQASMEGLKNPETNPIGSPTSPSYVPAVVHRWRQEDMPLKIYVRKNIQLPQYYRTYLDIVRDSMNLWCKATNEVVSYKFVDSKDAANIVCDYTEYKELVSSRHELGIDGICESMYRSKDNYRGPTSIVVLVKDRPIQPIIRSKEIVAGCCVHELGHALGMEHSTNRNDAMFPASIVHKVPLTQRDIVTIRKIYPELRTAGNAEMH